jgi:ribosomal-protein-alanine N-acetyltransferase
LTASPAPSLPSLRRAVAEDAAALSMLESRSFPQPWSRLQLAAELRHRAAFGLVAEDAGYLAGYALFRRVLDEAELLRLATALPWRRRGLGTLLVERGLGQVAADGCSTVFLEVREDNTGAVAFYERTGWRLAGRRPRYYADGVDALLYRRELGR